MITSSNLVLMPKPALSVFADTSETKLFLELPSMNILCNYFTYLRKLSFVSCVSAYCEYINKCPREFLYDVNV